MTAESTAESTPLSSSVRASMFSQPIDQPQPDFSLEARLGLAPVRLTILGAGAWGRELAELARANGHEVRIWSRRGELSLAEAIGSAKPQGSAEVVVSAISMKGVAEVAAQIAALGVGPELIVVSATKGLDGASLKTPSQLWRQWLPENPLVVLCGPNLSEEIRQGLPTATVVASEQLEAARLVQRVFASDRFRVYTNGDPLGTELGGTLKNVIAIASGVCDGLDLGTNAKSALITRALAEIIRVGSYLGGQPETFFGLSGLGDLLATCSSALSRNYRVGYGLAQGQSLEQILQDLQGTAEGVNTTRVLMQLTQREGISAPIARLVYLLLEGTITPQQAVEALMERDLKPEDD